MAERTIYSITEDEQTWNYSAPNAGSVLSAAKLLHALEKIKANLPKGSRTSVLEALNKEYNFVALKGKSFNLLHAMDDGEFAEALKKIEDGEMQDAYIKVDFDTGRIGFLYGNHGDASRLTLPIKELVDAYSGSLRNKNSSQCYVNTKHFAGELEKILEAQTEISSPEETTEEIYQTPKMSL